MTTPRASRTAPVTPAGRGARGPAPAPITTAVRLMVAQVALGLVGAALILVFRDAIAAAVARDPGLDPGMVAAGTSVIPVAEAVSAVVTAGLWVLGAVWTARGHRWARAFVTVLASLGALGSVVALALLGSGTGGVPLGITAVQGVLGLALSVTVLVLLWRPASTAFLRPRR